MNETVITSENAAELAARARDYLLEDGLALPSNFDRNSPILFGQTGWATTREWRVTFRNAHQPENTYKEACFIFYLSFDGEKSGLGFRRWGGELPFSTEDDPKPLEKFPEMCATDEAEKLHQPIREAFESLGLSVLEVSDAGNELYQPIVSYAVFCAAN